MREKYDRFIRNINKPRIAYIKEDVEYENDIYCTTILAQFPKPTRIEIKRFSVDWNVGGLINVWEITFTPVEGKHKGKTFRHESYGLDKLLFQYGIREKKKVRRLA
jgi:hypothetical protein